MSWISSSKIDADADAPMIVYLDSSVILRRVLGQPDQLREFRIIRTSVASRILEVECLRTIDRLRIEGAVSDVRLSLLREKVYESLAAMELVEVTRTVLARAAQPTPTALGSLDAIHLSSAIAWRERESKNLAFATHDQALALAARAQGFRVLGA
jgi:predicted nucleic acid-binding protein